MTLYTLQFLRFIAALLVLFFHLDLIHSGYKGVDIFFVISGFVMYYTLFSAARPNAFKFIVNRSTKIFFLYWVALIILYVILPYKIDLSSVKTFLLIPGHYALLGVSWSLSYELYFYFLIGVIAYLLPSRFQYSAFLLLLAASTFITFIDLTSLSLKGSLLNFLFGPHLWEFLLGILSAFLSMRFYKTIPKTIIMLVAIVSGLLLLAINITYEDPFSYVVYGIASFSIVCFITAYEKAVPVNKKLAGIFKITGDASYAMYLFGPVITMVIPPNIGLSKSLIIITTIAASILFNQIVENNFLRWSRKAILNFIH